VSARKRADDVFRRRVYGKSVIAEPLKQICRARSIADLLAAPRVQSPSSNMENEMDADRIKGAAEQAKGKIKEVAGKVTGDAKLETEGKADQVKGKVQNTVGGIKDTLKGN
jgi:uncharacterized protein YjbJ (UPF0337 family)